MPKITYPDNFKIEVVNHYRTHKSVQATLDKYGIAKSTLFKWKKQYERKQFSKAAKRKALRESPQARTHHKKIQEVIQAQRECKCPITASTDEKMKVIQ